jgi:hypothetical protein
MPRMGFLCQTNQAFLIEGSNCHADRLIATMQRLTDCLGLLPNMTFEKDLAATYGKSRW